MINIDTDKSQDPVVEDSKQELPDENPGILFQGFLKIHDPETGEIYMQGRA